MATTKALSNGTLSLRFMQNAQRRGTATTTSQQQKIHELEQAKIVDDAEWHVSKEVQDAWGIALGDGGGGSFSSLSSSSSSVTQEPSYLPFLFPDSGDVSSSSNVLKGRRSFKQGKEVVIDKEQESPKPDTSPSSSTTTPNPTSGPTNAKSRPAKRPVSISGFKKSSEPRPSTITSESPPSNNHHTKGPTTAQVLIHQNVDVGTDLKSARRQKPPHQTPQTASASPSAFVDVRTGFMKPAGVDAPPPASAKPELPQASSDSEQALPAGSESRAQSIIKLAKAQTIRKRARKGEEEEVAPIIDDHDSTVGESPITAPGAFAGPRANYSASLKMRKKKKTTMTYDGL